MVDAPDRIRVAQDDDGFWTCREAVSGSQEYVRADLYAALEANLAAVKEALEEIQGKGSALRQGGPDPMDLNDLSDALEEATDLAADALSALEATPALMVTESPSRCDGQLCYYHGCQRLPGCALAAAEEAGR